MKLLVLGIDGGDRRIFEALNLPNCSALFESGSHVSVKEDTWARGWVEQLTGLPSEETSGYYRKPSCDGTRTFVETFRGENYQESNIDPIWKRLNKRGHRVGLMNIPTTSPVSEVDGFFIGGAGGGSKKSGSAILESYHCYPPETKELLEADDYILDTRFMASSIKEIEPLVDRLCDMTRKRFETFGMLCEKYQTDFGYLCIRSLTVIQYLAMSEIEPLLQQTELEGLEGDRKVQQTKIQGECIRLYQVFDECFGQLFERLNPEHWLVAGDHGHVPLFWRVNLNMALRQIGEQKELMSAKLKGLIKSIGRKVVPKGRRVTTGKRFRSVIATLAADTDWRRTKAFVNMFYPGIYVNDKARFGGCVENEAEVDQITDRIVQKLNKLPQLAELDFKARPYRRNFKNAKFYDELPDVWIDAPDSYFFRAHGPLLERSSDYAEIADLREVTNDMYTGMKGQYPLLCADPETASLVRSDDPTNLCLVYHLIDRAMGGD